MWLCGKCGEQSEDTFDVCWKCGASRTGDSDPEFTRASDAERGTPAPADPMKCLRCRCTLEYIGRKRFHEGTNWGLFGEVGELFVNRQHFDVYVCSRCGKVELFVDGVGEQYRPGEE